MKEDLTFVHWIDKRDVWCLSTFHANQMVPFTRCQDVEAVTHLKIITDNNKYMGGVDRMDQMLLYDHQRYKRISENRWFDSGECLRAVFHLPP